MFDPDSANHLKGSNVRCLLEEIRIEFFARGAHEVGDGYRQINSARLVTIDVYDRLSIHAQVAILADLVRDNEQLVPEREAAEIFATADTVRAYVGDLVCEVVHAELMRDPLVAMEDESRETLHE